MSDKIVPISTAAPSAKELFPTNGRAKEPPVDGGELLNDLAAYFEKYVKIGADEYAVLAVWTLHCHAFAAATRTPYISVSSPVNGCGKTRLLEIIELVVPEGLLVSSITSAVLARAVNQFHPVLMLDEFDQLQNGDKDLKAAVLATINSGYKKSGYRLVSEQVKGVWIARKLSTFCPKVLSGISGLPTVTMSRCIPIRMERLLPDEHVEEATEDITEPEARALFHRAAIWSEQHIEGLRLAKPDVPPELKNPRQREVIRPLFAIGGAVGGVWPERIRTAVTRLFTAMNAEPSNDVKVQLLEDVQQLFDGKDRMASADLITGLNAMPDRPWSAWNRGKGLSQNQLARQLKDFKVYPDRVLMDDNKLLRGYEREWFEPTWSRYLPHTAVQTVTPSQPASLQDETHFSNRHKELDMTVAKCEKPAPTLACDGVTVQKPEWVGGRKIGTLICPGCKGMWQTAESLKEHLAQCKMICVMPHCCQHRAPDSPHCAHHQPTFPQLESGGEESQT